MLHDHDAVAEGADDLEVVGDEQVAEALLVLQLAQELDDLRLHREVERRRRLVEQDEFGLERDGAGDGDALALAAGELVRESATGCCRAARHRGSAWRTRSSRSVSRCRRCG